MAAAREVAQPSRCLKRLGPSPSTAPAVRATVRIGVVRIWASGHLLAVRAERQTAVCLPHDPVAAAAAVRMVGQALGAVVQRKLDHRPIDRHVVPSPFREQTRKLRTDLVYAIAAERASV